MRASLLSCALAALCLLGCNDNFLNGEGPDIAVSPLALDFGVPVPGSPTSRVVTISNVGGKTLNLNGLELTSETYAGYSFTIDDVDVFPVSLGPNDWVTVQVVLDAPESLNYEGTLLVHSSDSDESEVAVVLSSLEPGPDPVPDIDVSPTQLNFGDVQRLTCATLPLNVANTGTGPLDVTGIAINILGFVNDYTASPTGFQVLPASATVVNVEFCPSQTGPQLGEIEITSNDPDENPVIVSLFGNGTPPPVSATDIHVELTWDENLTDLDTHLLEPGGTFWDLQTDCHWRATSPDWGVGGPSDDPYLDVDDVDGFGPENINLVDPVTGSYKLVIHYYGFEGSTGDNGPTGTSVNIHLNGSATPTASFNTTIAHHQTWEVAWIHWDATAGTGTVEAIDTFGTYVPFVGWPKLRPTPPIVPSGL